MGSQRAGDPVPSIEVVAAVFRDRRGRVLIAKRPAGKPLAGFWEFPGGKLETGETHRDALRRELREELGIEVTGAYPLLDFSYVYPERRVHLFVWRVNAFEGEPRSHEGQGLAWISPDDLKDWRLLPADVPIANALRFPPLMLVTPDPGMDEDAFLGGIEASIRGGVDWLQLRAPELDAARFERLARAVTELCRQGGIRISLNCAPVTAEKLGADGVHLNVERLRTCLSRPWGAERLVGASVHNETEIQQALRCGADYLILGPVLPTASHPASAPLGWSRFNSLAALSPVPVYAIGGLGADDLRVAREWGAHGIAAVRSLWGGVQSSAGS